MLRVKQSELDKIQADNWNNSDKCLLEMLKWWLNNVAKPTWSDIVEALQSIKAETLAQNVHDTYCTGSFMN